MTGGMANMIDGRALAAEERRVLGVRVASLVGQGRQVRLDAILTEGDAGAEIYAQRQRAGAEQLGIQFHLHTIPQDADEAAVLACIQGLNADPFCLVTPVRVLKVPSTTPSKKGQKTSDF